MECTDIHKNLTNCPFGFFYGMVFWCLYETLFLGHLPRLHSLLLIRCKLCFFENFLLALLNFYKFSKFAFCFNVWHPSVILFSVIS